MELDLSQLEFVEPRLRAMALDAEEEFGVKFIVVSLYRIDDTGVHGQLPLRGLDFRCRRMDFGKLVEDYVNSKWQYDPSRPNKQCCTCHDVGRGLHLHLQVHPATIKR